MASKVAVKRLTKEYRAIVQSPPPYITAKPLESNILEWHYVLRGPHDTPYEGGEYHGRLKFPSEYPYKPPAIQMITPNGRFETNVNICMTMSNYHPNLWNPAWSVATILTGLLSFMVEDEMTTGGIRMSERDRKRLAKRSHAFNLENAVFRKVFPQLCTPYPAPLPEYGVDLKKRQQQQQQDEANNDNAGVDHAAATTDKPSSEVAVGPIEGAVVTLRKTEGLTNRLNRASSQDQTPKPADFAHAESIGPDEGVAQLRQASTWSNVIPLSTKWVVLFGVFSYFVISKVITRMYSQ